LRGNGGPKQSQEGGDCFAEFTLTTFAESTLSEPNVLSVDSVNVLATTLEENLVGVFSSVEVIARG